METTRIKTGTYMLLWFTDPDKVSEEQGLCTEFFETLKEAESSAELLSGDRIILMCTAQNPYPDKNIYWSKVKAYGKSFELNQLTTLPGELQQEFAKRGNN